MSAGRIIVSHSAEAVGLHLSQWKTQPTALLSPDETRELISRLQLALTAMKHVAQAERDQRYEQDGEDECEFV